VKGARVALLAALTTVSADGAAQAPTPYRADARIATVERALAAIAETPAPALQQGADAARTLARGACSAGAERLRVECMIVAAQRYCRELPAPDARCPMYMDIVVSNVLADERLIPLDRRYAIVRENADYRAALAAELRRVQGELAVDFRLQMGPAQDRSALAAGIDRYCRTTADKTTFPYQTCVSSLVYYIEETK
jgi:hypothetical protein